jgi:hypothetical protein
MWKAVLIVLQLSTGQLTAFTVMDFKTEQGCRDFVALAEKDTEEDFIIGGACLVMDEGDGRK